MSAVLSPDGVYRYRLARELGVAGPTVLFVMLNPSTADAETDDPTIRRCLGFATSWGAKRLEVVNLFAYRTTLPRKLNADARAGVDIVGPANDVRIREAVRTADFVVCAWGHHGHLSHRGHVVLQNLLDWKADTRCLGQTDNGHPRHPLYLGKDTALQPIWRTNGKIMT